MPVHVKGKLMMRGVRDCMWEGKLMMRGVRDCRWEGKLMMRGVRDCRWEGKLMRMHTAVQLNQAIRSRSSDAQIVIVNFPAPPSKLAAEENCFLLRHGVG